jgi:hypothetical protein
MIRVVVGSLVALWTGATLVLIPLGSLLYAPGWHVLLLGVIESVAFIGAIGLLRRREWGRQTLVASLAGCAILFAVFAALGFAGPSRVFRPAAYLVPLLLCLMAFALTHSSVVRDIEQSR